jgi:hypothetical protein
MNLIASVVLVTGLVSCVSNGSRKDSIESALHDPDHITLKPSIKYYFVEGQLEGRGQKFHSQYSYQRAIIIGNQSAK